MHSVFTDLGVALGGLVPRPDNAVLDGLPFASSDFRDSRAHWLLMKVDALSDPPVRFVARVSAAVTTIDRRPGLGEIFLATDTAFDSVLAVMLRQPR